LDTPSPEEARRASAYLGALAEIEAIVLRKLHWSANETPFDPNAPVQAQPTYNIGHGMSSGLIRYQVNASITISVPAGELARMESTHDVFFRQTTGDPPTELQLAAFGSVSVFFMVFPYIRQELHRLTGMAGIPPILLAPLRLPFEPATGAPSDEVIKALEP
jgi:preprotein translocase subunit SecB